MSVTERYKPEPRFIALGDEFSDAVAPAEFPLAKLRYWNEDWACRIGLEGLDEASRTAYFQRFEPLPENQAEPRALRYHGHQFRSYNPNIGDGRGFLHAQLRDDQGRLLDLATKGSGQTPWSRTGDGRLTLKGAFREILATEMLEALGVYTSKTFAVFETGEPLHRNDEPSPTRSAVLTRLGHSHVRFGMFQRHAYENAPERVLALTEHALQVYHPDRADAADPTAALLAAAVASSARLVASWMAAGFVHGVLNTDNLNITGESFDYGPWRFLPHYEPGFTAAYFDENGLYAFGRQPEAVYWALQQLAGALSIAGERSALEAELAKFPPLYREHLLDAFLARFGVASAGREADESLVRSFLAFMQDSALPWEMPFFDWFGGAASRTRAEASARANTYKSETGQAWVSALLAHEPVEPERLDHAYFEREKPVDLIIQRVEDEWSCIAEDDDWSSLDALLTEIRAAGSAYALGRGAGFLRD